MVLDVQKGFRSEKSKIEVHCSSFVDLLTVICNSEFSSKKCITELNGAADTLITKSQVVNCLRWYCCSNFLWVWVATLV